MFFFFVTNGMAKSLKESAAEALATATLFLDADAPEGEFEEYVTDTRWKDGGQAAEWVRLVTETGVYRTERDAVETIKRMCVGMDPRYPWASAEDASLDLSTWDAWCFCVARWARENDMEMVYHIPMAAPLDHRHAYAITGPSCNDAAKLSAFIERARDLVPVDWLETLVRPEMWHRSAFTLWALRAGRSDRLRARMLNSALAAAARQGNREAIRLVCFIVDRDADIKGRFWNAVELSKTYRLVIDALL